MTWGLSRRRRRVAVTSGLFGIFAIGVALATRASIGEDTEYTPGEDVDGLTDRLSRDLPPDHPRVRFVDATAAAGLGFRHFPGPRSRQLPEDMGSGAAWGDYDDDGWPDLFLVDIAGPLPGGSGGPAETRTGGSGRSVLYRNLGDGTFEDVTDEAGIAHRTVGMGASWADYDEDGHLDLFLTAYGENTLYRNRGDGTFEDVTRAAGMGDEPGFWTGGAWGDFDRDGRLDLYVAGYVRYTPGAQRGASGRQYDVEVPASLNPSAFRPHRNLLWHNEGDGTFREVSAAAGVEDREGRGLGVAWADFDEDGWLDLYVANDVSDNALYRNLGDGTFENVSHRALVADYRGAMGLAIADWDGDEDLDLFITHWIAQENALFSNRLADTRGVAGPGALQFIDEADRYGLGQIALDYIGWGASFLDYDNDGRLDLFVANGSTFERPDAPELLAPMPDQLFWNAGRDRGFYDVSSASGDAFRRQRVGRGAALADYDRDGDEDILVINHGAPPTLLRNESVSGEASLGILLEGRRSPRTANGARIRLVAGGSVQVRSVGSQTSYLSQNAAIQHFGLADATRVDTLEVTWPSGHRDLWTSIDAGRAVRAVEGEERLDELWVVEARSPAARTAGDGEAPDERARTLRFWQHQRAATRARVDGELEEAAASYLRALELDPRHEDALYYLGGVRIDLGDVEGASEALERLLEVNPRAGRGLSRLASLRACPRDGVEPDLEGAAGLLERAWALNREQVGPPLWLGLVGLLLDDLRAAAEHLDLVLGSDADNVAANILRGYVDWRRADMADAAARWSAAAAATAGGEASGLGEGDTEIPGSLFAGATSCPWLETALRDVLDEADAEQSEQAVSDAYEALHRRLRAARRR